MSPRVFSQVAGGALVPASFVRAASIVADARLVAVRLDDGALEVALVVPPDAREARFRLGTRPARAGDVDDARRAELAGAAAGMASLAERCAFVWSIDDVDAVSPMHRHVAEAVAAAVALGPVLPDDVSTLYGIRGAMQRARAVVSAAVGDGGGRP